jgi:hypothetical protein
MYQVLLNAVRGVPQPEDRASLSTPKKKPRSAQRDSFVASLTPRKLLLAGLALSARGALAAPVPRSGTALAPLSEHPTFTGFGAAPVNVARSHLAARGLVDDSNLTAGEAAQWNAMTQQELVALQGEAVQSTTIAANYAQAGIGASVASALPPSNPADILNDGLARAAEAQMEANYPATGSMDLTADQILSVYGPAISAAEGRTGVPARVLGDMIYIESKGHPLTSNGGLGQIDPVAWGQMVDANPALENRYIPADNIMAAAMYLASKAGAAKPASYDAWMALYHAAYQG